MNEELKKLFYSTASEHEHEPPAHNSQYLSNSKRRRYKDRIKLLTSRIEAYSKLCELIYMHIINGDAVSFIISPLKDDFGNILEYKSIRDDYYYLRAYASELLQCNSGSLTYEDVESVRRSYYTHRNIGEIENIFISTVH